MDKDPTYYEDSFGPYSNNEDRSDMSSSCCDGCKYWSETMAMTERECVLAICENPKSRFVNTFVYAGCEQKENLSQPEGRCNS